MEEAVMGLRAPPVAESCGCMGDRYELQSSPVKYEDELA